MNPYTVQQALSPVEEILDDLSRERQIENLVTHHSLDDPSEARKAQLRAALRDMYENDNNSRTKQ